jgi:hypothetical protein
VAMKVLIIGPAFFDYTKAIAVEINSREVYAFVFNELHSETILSRPIVGSMYMFGSDIVLYFHTPSTINICLK